VNISPKCNATATEKRSFHTDESEEAMRTNWPAYVAAEMNRIVADEEAFERLVELLRPGTRERLRCLPMGTRDG
jgi:hypothetical protein